MILEKHTPNTYDIELLTHDEFPFRVSIGSDDTGLEVEYLNGDPGVYSARWAGEADPFNWSEAGEEKFAEAFELYMREGIAPAPEMKTPP